MVEQGLERMNGEAASFRQGETIFREGETGRHMYVLTEGAVDIYIQSGGARIPVARFAPGDFFGEMSLLEGLPRSGTAVAAANSKLVVLDEASFRNLVSEDSALAMRIMKSLSQRIRNHNQELTERIGNDLQDVSAHLGNNASGIHRGIENIAASAAEIEMNEKRLAEEVKDVKQLSEQIVSTLGFLQQVARQTHILGLNAGIEAARSGEFGRGFQVIAEEIRHLSKQSKENAEKISLLTEQIGGKIARVAQASEDSARRSIEQAEATRQMVEATGEVTQLAQRLEQLSESLQA
ncbi:cyclic nucleotide-binding domain-containing protein [Paenibacillus cymbidii]|uniref:cyclic nucleotide-binding domain-containing protein n=1 Tax=Paenibacillus cymbidii TaxID=1639034 RepID=UPI0010804054|nr:cyclic nucleotide-binding domain-containing protein [Paenibacillus cymbidii]